MKNKRDSAFTKKLMSLVMPIAFQQFMLALVSASDALMLGMISQNSLSAVSLAGQVTFIHSLLLEAMTIGLSLLAAQYWGKGDIPAVERIFAYVMKITTLISLLFTLSALLVPGLLMKIFTNDPVLIRGGSVYLRVIAVSYLLTGISQMYLCILKNSGRAGKSSMISATSVIINIFINAVLIYGLFGIPRMEIAGAALATVTARVIEVVWCVCETSRKDQVKLRAKYLLRNDIILRRDFWKYTTPVICNEIVWGTGFSMYSVIMGHLGTDAVAANSIANIVKNLAACFCMGLGNGGGIMVGNELGAGKPDTAREYGGRLCRLAVASGIVSGLILLACSPLILRVANLSTVSREYLQGMLLICAYYMIGRSVNGVTISGIFCAGGDSRFGLYCDCITMWCIIVPLGLIAAFILKLPVLAVYFVVSLDEFVKIPAVYRNYKKYRWVRDLTVKTE
ncbi:MATE family efflux transporter [Blautia sp. CLA-JM-H16]|uniref:MATE family efflux transporter n=1 Tax=Blautia aquisgranensis TaxID=3133153 RepID=A0ABV1BIR5_9FIRM